MHTVRLFRFGAVAVFCLLSVGGFAEQFAYRYAEGDSYRILSRVFEDVYVNRMFHHKAEIVNRISVNVTAAEKGSGTHEAVFVTSEKSVCAGDVQNAGVFSWGQEYRSVFTRDSRGIYDISDEYFMPVVRNIPVFPDYDINPGATWTFTGQEAHDLRAGFGIQKPFIVPFTAEYVYTGTENIQGKTLHKITAEYTLMVPSPKPPADSGLSDYPVETMGYSKQHILWDNESGMPVSYSEVFRIVLKLASGNTMEFTGTAEAELTEKTLNRTVAEKNVRDEIDRLGVDNATVTADDRGITISIENIQFKANSSQLYDSEKEKLNKIAEILRAYPDNDLLITGHTALAGTPAARQQLSQERAAAVAAYLVQQKVKEEHRIFSRGLGSEQPVADNSTPEGMSRNRRVEITILEN